MHDVAQDRGSARQKEREVGHRASADGVSHAAAKAYQGFCSETVEEHGQSNGRAKGHIHPVEFVCNDHPVVRSLTNRVNRLAILQKTLLRVLWQIKI